MLDETSVDKNSVDENSVAFAAAAASTHHPQTLVHHQGIPEFKRRFLR